MTYQSRMKDNNLTVTQTVALKYLLYNPRQSPGDLSNRLGLRQSKLSSDKDAQQIPRLWQKYERIPQSEKRNNKRCLHVRCCINIKSDFFQSPEM